MHCTSALWTTSWAYWGLTRPFGSTGQGQSAAGGSRHPRLAKPKAERLPWGLMEGKEVEASADKRAKKDNGSTGMFNSDRPPGKAQYKTDDGRSEEERYDLAEMMLTEEAPWTLKAQPALSLTYMLRRCVRRAPHSIVLSASSTKLLLLFCFIFVLQSTSCMEDTNEGWGVAVDAVLRRATQAWAGRAE